VTEGKLQSSSSKTQTRRNLKTEESSKQWLFGAFLLSSISVLLGFGA
jgi:hypothetical protein